MNTMTIYSGPDLLSLAHATRRDDLRRAAEARLGWTAQPNRSISHRRHRPWWWGLARGHAA